MQQCAWVLRLIEDSVVWSTESSEIMIQYLGGNLSRWWQDFNHSFWNRWEIWSRAREKSRCIDEIRRHTKAKEIGRKRVAKLKSAVRRRFYHDSLFPSFRRLKDAVVTFVTSCIQMFHAKIFGPLMIPRGSNVRARIRKPSDPRCHQT